MFSDPQKEYRNQFDTAEAKQKDDMPCHLPSLLKGRVQIQDQW